MKKYAVFTSDVVSSKKKLMVENSNIEIIVTTLNEMFSDILVTDLVMQRGDEFQAIIEIDNRRFFEFLRYYKYLFLKEDLEVRIAVSSGAFNKSIEQARELNNSWLMNGPAFYKARDLIEEISSRKTNRLEAKKMQLIDVDGLEPIVNDTINMLYAAVEALTSKWKLDLYDLAYMRSVDNDFYQVTEEYVKKYNETNTTIENKYHSLSKKMSRNHWQLVVELENQIISLIKGANNV